MSPMNRFVPWFVLGAGTLYLLMAAVSPGATYRGMQLDEFGELPVHDHGRAKPLDTYARMTLLVISGKQTFKDEQDNTRPAIQWFLDAITRNPALHKYKVFRIENDNVLGLLALEPRSGLRYSYSEIAPKIEALKNRAALGHKRPAGERDQFDVKALELWRNVGAYHELAGGWENTLRLFPPPRTEEDEARRRRGESPRPEAEEWLTFEQAAKSAKTEDQMKQIERLDATLRAYKAMSQAAPERDTQDGAVAFNSQVAAYRDDLNKQAVPGAETVAFEASFNHFEPFYHCSVLYVFVFVLGCVAWLNWREPLTRSAFFLVCLTVVLHTWALGARMYIGGRPPVTNLYSSAIFIGWGCVVLGIVLEVIFKNGLGNIVAAVTGSLAVLIAHHLASSGDTLEMLVAVLDTNFWLATHVTCITLGYTATFVAGFLGILYVLGGVFTTALTRENSKSLGQMIYGVVCFATLLSFVGTVLGGIWADQSWGRFWGWDPKENGALLIVIINALILHARWGGMIKERGMAVLTLVGNMVTMWSWFGTNQLGVGLHNYGFNNTLAMVCTAVWGFHLGLIGLGLVPLNLWRSFCVVPAPAAAAPTAGPAKAPKGKRGRGSLGITGAR